jgi:type I restriction enzyme M protein
MAKNDIYTKKNLSSILWNCYNIIRGNDKLSPEVAFDEISKVLFLKICQERYYPSADGVCGDDEYKSEKKEYEATTSQV